MSVEMLNATGCAKATFWSELSPQNVLYVATARDHSAFLLAMQLAAIKRHWEARDDDK